MRLVLFTLPVYLLLTAAPVLAEKPSAPEPFPHVAVRLSFKTIDGCPGERAFRAEVASWVGYDPFSPEGEDLITIWFERAGPLFASSFTLTTSDQTSGIHREFEATCTGLFRTMGIGVGLAIAPSDGPPPLVPTPPPPEPPPECPPPPVLAAPPSVAPPALPLPAPAPPPPKRSLQLVAGADGIVLSSMAPSAMVGVSLWAGVNFNLLNLPLAFEHDLRSTWSVVPAKVPLPSQSIVAVRTAYVSGVVAGCWRGSITVCPLLEVGRASYSQAGTIGEASRSSILIAAGLRAVYARPITERFVLRGLVEVEGIPRPFSISDEAGHRASTPSPVSLTLGIGFGGSP